MDSSTPAGLSSAEAARRLAADGPNALPAGRNRLLGILLDAMREPMFLLLLGSALLYLALGDWHEGLLLLVMVGFTIGITLYQQGRTERALAALRDLSSPRALVLRDGQTMRVAAQDLVCGDLLLVAEGDRIAADAVLLSASNLQVNESLLTGESAVVSKRPAMEGEAAARPGGDDLPYLWSGTLVVRGDGLAKVTATGLRSEMGRIGSVLDSLGSTPSPLQQEMKRTVKVLAIAGAALSLIVIAIYSALHGQILQAVLAGIALSMSLLPEEFPVIMAVFPAIGAWRMSRAQVLTRRLAAIETLGAISVLCTDKTGTLTENRMRVERLHADGQELHVAGQAGALHGTFTELAQFATLASKPQPFDPMERAFHALAPLESGQGLLREYPLAPELRAMSMAWQTHTPGEALAAAKGAPEDIARLCGLDHAALAVMRAAVDAMAGEGLRVLAVAQAALPAADLPPRQQDIAFRYLGLVGLADPLRAEIPDAVRQCREAGIRVIMITGDYAGTARSIAGQAGLAPGAILSGDDLDHLDDDALCARLRHVSICARITPQQKLRIVQGLKANGDVVAMTGDGVNDAPALKAAHVGVAMGGRGTDVAREAAALVLLDDNFASIVRGIRMGRRIFSNMRNAMAYVLSIHVPIAGMALLPALFGWPMLLYPMHIAFLELIIDPACSLAFENEASEAEAMQRAPRRPDAPLLDRRTVVRAVLQGFTALAVVALAYLWALRSLPEGAARAGGFAVLVVANLALIFSNLSYRRSAAEAIHSRNHIPLYVAGGAIGMLLLALYVPGMTTAFHFSHLTPGQLAGALAIGTASLAGYEFIKRLFAAHKERA